MAAGTPVIASDIPGYRSVSPDGKAVHYVPPEDSKALARAILRLMSYPERAAELRREGLDRVGRFSWAGVATDVLGYYRELLAMKAGAAGFSLEAAPAGYR